MYAWAADNRRYLFTGDDLGERKVFCADKTTISSTKTYRTSNNVNKSTITSDNGELGNAFQTFYDIFYAQLPVYRQLYNTDHLDNSTTPFIRTSFTTVYKYEQLVYFKYIDRSVVVIPPPCACAHISKGNRKR